ncbi:hypothetical protein LPW26_11570 [Rhodopseudomonas sp. HC1]|uniref:hypothetical protein n=1 Tax=Rhodopseudomonas infernalis TaxID=2897386 RepID=UPI001EE8A8A3|nr:hypothetical protein [Rhodopseudomonas infernalis]MCG6205281.1 hypothetical protein [Rhodopseudomonas infernalis]
MVVANDKGHAAALREFGASPSDIRSIGDADRAAQGISEEIEQKSRRAVANGRMVGTFRLRRR